MRWGAHERNDDLLIRPNSGAICDTFSVRESIVVEPLNVHTCTLLARRSAINYEALLLY